MHNGYVCARACRHSEKARNGGEDGGMGKRNSRPGRIQLPQSYTLRAASLSRSRSRSLSLSLSRSLARSLALSTPHGPKQTCIYTCILIDGMINIHTRDSGKHAYMHTHPHTHTHTHTHTAVIIMHTHDTQDTESTAGSASEVSFVLCVFRPVGLPLQRRQAMRADAHKEPCAAGRGGQGGKE